MRQVDPEAGNIGNWLNTNIFTLDAPGKRKEQERIDDMVAFDPKYKSDSLESFIPLIQKTFKKPRL